jgi:small basic protein (TIGR04137 family)
MSVHTSLTARKGIGHRNVLKRHERIEKLQEQDRWTAGDSPVGLPKVKSIKFKAKKSVGAKPDGDATGTDATAAATAKPAEAKSKTKS